MTCPNCQLDLISKSSFCPNCGFNLKLHQQNLIIATNRKKWSEFKFLLIFYVLYFIVIGLLNIYPALKESPLGEFILPWIALVVTIVFLFFSNVDKKIIYSKFKLGQAFVYITATLLVSLSLNCYYFKFIHFIFGLPSVNHQFEFYENDILIFYLMFYDCVMPAITEEIAFRLIIFEKFMKIVSIKEAIFLSSVLFAILHLDFYSTPYLIFFGALLCIVRQNTKSLIPCILIHFLHNFYIVLVELQII